MVDYVFERHLSGGILLPANKTTSTSAPIHRGFVPSQLVLAMQQHRGSAAEPAVRIGERVRKGQCVATPSPGPSAAVHASTSGWVRAIEERPVLAGAGVQPSLCIVVETDGRDERVSPETAPAWPVDRALQLAAIRAAGIVGLGGAVYPTADKLATPVACKTLIVNGAECEPYISCDDMLMRENAADIVAGALLMANVLAAPLCIIAIERDKPRAIEAIEGAAKELDDSRLKLAEVPTIYPAGGERQLVELLTGEEVPSGRYPSEFGYVCQNVGTAVEVRLDPNEWPCIRCGDCAMVCPSRLLPQELLVAARGDDLTALKTLGLQDCIECGCCDVICPSHIALTEQFRAGKRAVASNERKGGGEPARAGKPRAA